MTRYRRDLAAARQRLTAPPAPVEIARTPYGEVEFTAWGQGPRVLVIHGNNGGWDQAVDWAQRRLDPGFGVVAVSRYGYLGSSLPPGASTAGQADALAALLDHLGIDRVDVVSLSAGSTTAALLAISHPDRVGRLVLESAVLPAAKPQRLPPAVLLKALLRTEWPTWWTTTKPAAVARASGVRWSDLDQDSRDELMTIMSTMLPVVPRRPGMMFDNVTGAPQMLRDEIPWEQLTAPALVITARDSPLPRPADAAAVVDRLPHGKLLVMPHGGHLLLGNVEALRRAIRAFLLEPEDAGQLDGPTSRNC
ncbi:alpha/beta fold hydrolase [Actinoplanes sp. N902-109]|uniref:alpha/beta fold hydrolase n=1 Tax=Actinoplanes sp. (strain N902-109) TaxID=649831 RepID=UPI0003295E69|nr:alpha/beta hydrolase [Actinoplanes sp. N902-109]AGL15866.1 putative esterase [Actinoplanes sp. N902-109]